MAQVSIDNGELIVEVDDPHGVVDLIEQAL